MKKINTRSIVQWVTVVSAFSLVAACATTADQNPALDKARVTYQTVSHDPAVARYASVELQEAKESLEIAEAAWESNQDTDEIEQLAYVATRRAQIAGGTAQLATTKSSIEQIASSRDKVIIASRNMEIEQANYQIQQQAQQATSAALRVKQLENEIQGLKTQETERGIILTLTDVLFDVNQATLKPGASVNLARIATTLAEYPGRKVLIEGFTDSVGEVSYNQQLSEQRTQTVRTALIENGVNSSQILTRGYGESYPVATNDTSVGRQQNRRVEIVLANQDGVVPTTR